jgi:hypothetical protein
MIQDNMVRGNKLVYVSWFLISRVALLGICVGVPLAFGYLLGWLSS